jgi:hypothetical protein
MVGSWHHLFGTFNGIVLLTVLALPLAALAVWALAVVHRRHSHPRPRRMALAEVGIVYGTAPWLWMMLLPGGRAGEVTGRISLVPVRDILELFDGGVLTAVGQIVGNLLPFAALGFFVPLRFAALASVPRVLGLGAGLSVLVEVTQYVLQLDRVSSVDDVLINTAGAGLAALASRRWWPATAKPRPLPVDGSQIGSDEKAADHGAV